MEMKKKSNLLQSESGQMLIIVIIVLTLAALVLPSIVGLTYSSVNATNIRTEKMQILYAADSGIEDALLTLDKLGNGTDPGKVPEEIGHEKTYNLTVTQSGLPVYVTVTIYKDGNGTYLITSTANNWDERKVTVQAHVHAGPKNLTIYQPGKGNVSTSPFDYALASLGSGPIDFAGVHAPTIKGDIYSNGPIDFPSGSQVLPDEFHEGNVWANGTVNIGSGSLISGSVHSAGDITLGDGAFIAIDAYANGNIHVTGIASEISGSAAAYGAINVRISDTKATFGSDIGNSTVANGDIYVSGPVSSGGFNIGGNVASNQNVIVDNYGVITGNVSAAGSVTHSQGNITGTITDGADEFILTLDEIPTLVANDVEEWRLQYLEESQATPQIGTYPPIKGTVNYYGPIYIFGDLDLQQGTTIYLTGTVYVTGKLTVNEGCNILGSNKLVAGSIDLKTKVIGNETQMPLLMSLGELTLANIPASQKWQNIGILNAVLYAPYDIVDISNWYSVNGSIVAQGIVGQQGLKIAWQDEVRNIPGLPGGNVTQEEGGWNPVQELQYVGVYIDWYKVCDNENCS